MAQFAYSPDYYCDVGSHVFKMEKYRLLHDRLVDQELVSPDEFLTPQPADREALELVHTDDYLNDLRGGRHTHRTVTSEMPISRGIVDSYVLHTGGTILACRTTLQQHTMSMNMAGGWHHAFADHAEGFCYINDVAVGMKKMLQAGLIKRGIVVDCDLHQGNGTARIFRDEPAVFTFSIHQEALYPIKQKSDRDVGLRNHCGGEEYLEALENNLLPALDEHEPEFAIFVAGADPYEKDQLGSLDLTIEHLRRRDDLVIGQCQQRDIPVTALLAGGYAPDVNDTVRIHLGTARSLIEHPLGN